MQNLDPGVWKLAEAIAQFGAAKGRQAQYFWMDDFSEALRWETPCWSPHIDIFRDKNDLQLRIELPGVTLSQIEMLIESDKFVIRGQRPGIAGSGMVLQRDIYFGKFERQLTLPHPNYLLTDMQLENGVLQLRLERFT